MFGSRTCLVGDGDRHAGVGAHGGGQQVDGLHDARHYHAAAGRQQLDALALVEGAAEELQSDGTIRDEIGIALTASFCSHHDHGAAGRQQLDALALVEGARPC